MHFLACPARNPLQGFRHFLLPRRHPHPQKRTSVKQFRISSVPALGDVAGTGIAAPHKGTQNAAETTSATSRQEGYEFRPELVSADLGISKRPLDAKLIRQDFPILEERVHGRPLIWLDNAATTQKPNAVIDRISDFYRHENSNIHRAAHELAARATDAYESAREKTRRFLNASTTREIIFVRGATEGINLIAQAWGRRNVREGHMPVDVQSLDCDFYVFSGRKVFGPTGIGVVYGKLDVLDGMPRWQGGGNMIADVTFENVGVAFNQEGIAVRSGHHCAQPILRRM